MEFIFHCFQKNISSILFIIPHIIYPFYSVYQINFKKIIHYKR